MRLRRIGAEAQVTRIGKYLLGQVLGEGPLGKAYEATDTETGERVVIRGFVRPEDADDDHWNQAISRFRQELEKAVKLDHPNIVPLIDFGEMDGIYYIATEFFQARNLRRVIDEDPAPDLERLVVFLETVAKVFQFADIHGITHGDITPYNLLFPDESPRTVKVLNYGVAQVRKKLGSPYLAPEQLTGFVGDIRSDFYSLGVVTYEWLTKRNPFQAGSVEETSQRILSVLPDPVDGVPDYFNGILQGLMQKNPADRYATAEDLIRDLKARQATKISFGAGPVSELVWEPTVYQPPPTLADYSFHQTDIKALHFHLQKKKAIARAKRRWILSGVVTLSILIPLSLLTLHSFYRYRDEGTARLSALTGSVKVLRAGYWSAEDLREGTVAAGDLIQSSSGSKALVRLPDGSRLLVDGESLLLIRALGRDKGARKVSFGLIKGRSLFSVRPIYGTVHRFIVRTPHLKAEVKGTGFEAVVQRQFSTLSCLDGEMRVEAPDSSSDLTQGQQITFDPIRQQLSVRDLSPEQRSALQNLLAQLDLSSFERMSHWLADVGERFLLDPVLTVLQTVQAGREIYQQALDDAQAQSIGMVAIRALCLSLEGRDEYPSAVGLTDLSGLGLPQKDARKILSAFDGNRLLSYESDGRTYRFQVRLRDTKGTVVTVENGRIRSEQPTPSSKEHD